MLSVAGERAAGLCAELCPRRYVLHPERSEGSYFAGHRTGWLDPSLRSGSDSLTRGDPDADRHAPRRAPKRRSSAWSPPSRRWATRRGRCPASSAPRSAWSGNDGRVDGSRLAALPGVQEIIHVTKPYKQVSREWKPESTVVRLPGGLAVGGDEVVVMAGPCSVESERQILDAARAVREAGATVLRAGAFKPRSSPYSFQGLGRAGLKLLARAREETGLLIVTEAMDAEGLDQVRRGRRHRPDRRPQHAELLAAQARRPLRQAVLLKRGLSATIQELLLSAEYILAEGNPAGHPLRARRPRLRPGHPQPLRPERHRRWCTASPTCRSWPIPATAPATATWSSRWRAPRSPPAPTGSWSRCTPTPDRALSDGAQSLYPEQFERMMKEIAAHRGGDRPPGRGAGGSTRVMTGRLRAAGAASAPAPVQAQDAEAIVGRRPGSTARSRSLTRRLRAGHRQPDDRQRGEPRHAGAGGRRQARHAVHRSAGRGHRDRRPARLGLHAEHGARPGASGWRCRAAGRSTATTSWPGCSTGRPSATRRSTCARTSSNGRTVDVVELVPAVPDLPFERAVVWLDREDGLPRRLEITEQCGAHRTLTLSKLRVNRSVPDRTFDVQGAVRRPGSGSVSCWRRRAARARAARCGVCARAVARPPGRSGGRRAPGGAAPPSGPKV